MLELTTRVVRQSDEIAKLNRRVSLLEEEIKIRASNDKKIEALEARITSQINAAVSAAVLAATAQSSLDIVVPSAKAQKKHVTIAPIATSSSQQQGLETPMRNQHSVLPQRMSICNRPPPASFRGNTVDNVTMSSRTPVSSVPLGRVPLTTLQSGVGTTPFIGQAAGMGRFGARVLPGRGSNLPTENSNQFSTNLAEQVNVRTGRTLTDSSRNSANTVAESGVDSVINSRSSLYMPTFSEDDIDDTILDIDGDNIFDSADLSRQKTPSGMPSLNSFNVDKTPSAHNGASPHDNSFQNSSYSSLVSTMPPQYAATQSMHKL